MCKLSIKNIFKKKITNTAIIPNLVNFKVQILYLHVSTWATFEYMPHSTQTDLYFKTNSIMFMNPEEYQTLSKIKIESRNTVRVFYFEKTPHICLNFVIDTPQFKITQNF